MGEGADGFLRILWRLDFVDGVALDCVIGEGIVEG